MPNRGGAAEKFGDHYEGKWTVFCMVDVLEETAAAIHIEALDPLEKGIEFLLQRNGPMGHHWEHHQVKRQSTDGKWSMNRLKGLGVLADFWRILKSVPSDKCIFVSMQDAYELRELADRARNGVSWAHFRQYVLTISDMEDPFNQLCEAVGASDATGRNWSNVDDSFDPRTWVFDALKRVEVWPLPEHVLNVIVDSRLEKLVDGLAPATARAVLADFAFDQLHHDITASAIWRHLEEHGARQHRWGEDKSVLASVRNRTEIYLDDVRAQLPTYDYLARSEVDQVLDLLADSDKTRWVIVTGDAGGGKSSLLAEVLRRTHTWDWPTLAFRLDILQATPSPQDLGHTLELPGSPPVVLGRVAAGRPCLLVIDQLDAVGSASGRTPDLFACVQTMLLQARDMPNMRVLLACRSFDLESSGELQRLDTLERPIERVTIEPLNEADIREVVLRIGLDANKLTQAQFRLLASPLHLRLLSEVAVGARHVRDALAFATATDLFAHYWAMKERAVEKRTGASRSWTDAIDVLVDDMSERHRLVTPHNKLDAVSRGARALASEHVLVEEIYGKGRGYRFFHESFFDYAFARSFLRRGHRIADFLHKEGQELFRRAQIRQILRHQRDEDQELYLEDLHHLLSDAHIRYHLRALALDQLGQFDDPLQEEWALVRAIVEGASSRERGDEALARRALGLIVGWPVWRDLVDRLDVCREWLASPDPWLREAATRVLGVMQAIAPDRVAELLLPYVNEPGRYSHILWILQATEAPGGDAFRLLMTRSLEAGIFDPGPTGPRGYAVAVSIATALDKHDPAWVCEFLGVVLTRALARSEKEREETHPYDAGGFGLTIDRSGRLFGTFLSCAKAAPKAFVAHLLPYMQLVVAANLPQEPNEEHNEGGKHSGREATLSLRRDHAWGTRYRDSERVYTVRDALPMAMEAAFQHLNTDDPGDRAVLDQAIADLREPNWSTTNTGCYLLLRAYAAAGSRLSEDAVLYLADHPEAFRAGYVDREEWAAREVLEAATPWCSLEALANVERAILAHFPPYELRPDARKHRGFAQFVLLGGIDDKRISPLAARRLAELRRKFGMEDANPPQPAAMVSDVLPPIPVNRIAKMNDDQWLRAIARYQDDDLPTRQRLGTGQIVGGARQLAYQLHIASQNDPARFAALAMRIPADANPAYISAVLGGLRDADLEEKQLVNLCRHVHTRPDHPYGHELCRFIGMRLGVVLSREAQDALLDILAWYAIQAPDPTVEASGSNAEDTDEATHHDIYSIGLNSVRGEAAVTLAAFLEADPSHIARLDASDPTVIDHLVRDQSVAVRTCSAGVAAAVAQIDPDRAVNLLTALVECGDAIFTSPHTNTLVRRLLFRRPEVLGETLARMRTSAHPQVALHGAMHTCVLGLLDPRWAMMAATCLDGQTPLRLGAARVYAANITQADCRAVCEAALARLFDDADEEVRGAASGCFTVMNPDAVVTFSGTIMAFLKSAALEGHAGELFAALSKAQGGTELATLLCEACAQYLERAGDEVGDIRTAAAAHADTVADLIVRAYNSVPNNRSLQQRCLDVIDGLLREQTLGIGRVLDKYER